MAGVRPRCYPADECGHRLGREGRRNALHIATLVGADARCPPTPNLVNAASARSIPQPYRVLIADPHAATRDAIGAVLQEDGRFALAGSAATIEETIRLIREQAPDVLVLDPWLFGPGGLPGCLMAKRLRPGLRIVALVPEAREEYPQAAMAMGVDAAVAKPRVGRDLIRVMWAALDRPA